MRLGPLVMICALAATAGAYPDKSLIRREIRIRMGKFKVCYEKELAKQPGLKGTVVATFTIGATGVVTESSATGMPGVEECVANVIRAIKFSPPPGSKGSIRINYPFAFSPD